MTTVNEISAKQVAELRAKTGACMMDCKKALEESGGDMAKAEDLLRVKYAARAEKRSDRAAGQGVVEIYLHFNGTGGTRVEAATGGGGEPASTRPKAAKGKTPGAVKEKIIEGKLKKFYQENVLLEQPFVKDDKGTIGDLVKAMSGKTGEKG